MNVPFGRMLDAYITDARLKALLSVLTGYLSDVPEALTVGLAHTVFNVLGIALLYVPRFIRYVPVRLAEGLAEVAFSRPAWAVIYVMTAFIVLPLIGVGLFG